MSTREVLGWACSGGIAFFLNVVGVAVMRRWATAKHILDLPNPRSSHALPTPRGGGLVLVVVTMLGTLFGMAAGVVERTSALAWLGVGGLLIAIVSWLEDVRRVPRSVRFCAHLLAAVLVVVGLGGPRILVLPWLGVVRLGLVGQGLALVWVVGLANATNFMDGIDGLAGGQAVVAGLGWILLAESNAGVQWVALLLAAGSLGFLVHNWPPARIFMGDVGAVFLGFSFASLALVAGRSDPRAAFAGVLVVWPFVFDTAFTFMRRLVKGEDVLAAHRSHLYQRLVIAGFSHASVSSLYIALAAGGVVLAKLWLKGGAAAGNLVAVAMTLGGIALWVFTVRAERLRASNLGASQG